MTNHFTSNSGEQNIAQGDHAIGKQVNINQQITGNNNVVSATGDIHIHQPPLPVISRQIPPLDACFLGRDEELAALLEQLQPGKVVAVCGPGGMGKSALAAQAVSKLEPGRFPDGIVFHGFYHQPSTDMALQRIAKAFNIEAEPNLAIAVQDALLVRKALLILDGTEEAEDLTAVVRLRGQCGVLITSRKRSDAKAPPLNIKPLDKQSAEKMFRFYSQAAADDPSVQGICRILNGWPVALRIAGHYVNSKQESTADYLRWLEQEPFKPLEDGKHQEENAALLLRRSVAQVSDDARLALGVAGCLAFAPIAREPVTAILEKDERRARKALGELVNYGLLETSEERWQVSHALVHTYARTELALSKESLEKLAQYYIAFCFVMSEIGLEGYAHLDGERVHCLRLMESCLASGLWKEVQALVNEIVVYLDLQGWWPERIAALEMLLTAARQADDRKDEGWCLNSLGYTCERRGEREKALTYYEQCLPIRRELGDRQGESITLNNIAAIYSVQGKRELALEQYQQSLSIQREVGDGEVEGTTLNNIGLLYMEQGDNETALQYYDQAIPIRREAGDKIGEGVSLNSIALIYYKQCKFVKAIEYYEQSLAIRQQLGDRAGEALTRWNIGRVYEDQGDLSKAEEYISQAVQIAEQIDHPSLEKWREGLTLVRVIANSKWQFLLYKGFSTLRNWLRAVRHR